MARGDVSRRDGKRFIGHEMKLTERQRESFYKRVRLFCELRVRDVSRATGLSEFVIDQIEKGRRRPNDVEMGLIHRGLPRPQFVRPLGSGRKAPRVLLNKNRASLGPARFNQAKNLNESELVKSESDFDSRLRSKCWRNRQFRPRVGLTNRTGFNFRMVCGKLSNRGRVTTC